MRAHIILGPGRSGSSALARSLSARGISFGAGLKGADCLNRIGYYENLTVSGINQVILLEGGSFNGDFAHHLVRLRKLSTAEEQALDRLIARMDSGEIGLKCPRFCVTYGSWAEYFRSRFSEVRLYLCLRDPVAVANSLVSTGRARNHALLWWASYVISALERQSPEPIEIVAYRGDSLPVQTALEQDAVDLWEEARRRKGLPEETIGRWRARFEEDADWLPRGFAAARSIEVVSRLYGFQSPFAASLRAAFPAYHPAWSARPDYITADEEALWRSYGENILQLSGAR